MNAGVLIPSRSNIRRARNHPGYTPHSPEPLDVFLERDRDCCFAVVLGKKSSPEHPFRRIIDKPEEEYRLGYLQHIPRKDREPRCMYLLDSMPRPAFEWFYSGYVPFLKYAAQELNRYGATDNIALRSTSYRLPKGGSLLISDLIKKHPSRWIRDELRRNHTAPATQ